MASVKDLPLAPGDRHVRAFGRLGWSQRRKTRGSHAILEHPDCRYHISIPCHRGKDVKRRLLADQLILAGISIDEYLAAFK